MASNKSQGATSPSVSSTSLPLGRHSRRGSHVSHQNPEEQESLAEKTLDQAHHEAYQSSSLTTFNEFTEPPDSSVVDNKGLVGDLQGGLSGLYSRFRGMVGASSKAPEAGPSDTLPVKSPKAAHFPTSPSPLAHVSSSEAASPDPNAVQGSKVQSPNVEVDPAHMEGQGTSSAPKTSRVSSKAPSLSSKSSAPSSNAPAKTQLTPLTSIQPSGAADPTVTELNVSAVKENNHHKRTNSDALSVGSLQNPERPRLEQPESSSAAPTATSSQEHDPESVYRSKDRGPKANREQSKYRERPELRDLTRLPSSRDLSTYENPTSPAKAGVGGDRVSLTELDTSFAPSQRKGKRADGDYDKSLLREGTPDDIVGSTPADNSPADTSVSNSVSKLSTAESSNHDGRTPTTLDTSLSMTDREASSAHSSKASIRRQQERQAHRVNQPRLPGFELSRKGSSGTAETRSTAAASQSTSNLPGLRSSNSFSHQNSETSRLPDGSQKSSAYGDRSRLLGREFWMRDENAKDCFFCGEPFSTFRRKHHCRACGQIFDAKCTSLVSGAAFGHSGSIRVCLHCDAVVNAQDNDSSESSSDELSPIPMNHRHSDNLSYTLGSRLPVDDDDSSSIVSQSVDQVLKTPTMAIPATRRTGEGNNRRSAILEIDSDRQLARPTSSRSLRSSVNGRTHSVSHKRHHSRQQYVRSFKAYHDDRAPFQRRAGDDASSERKLPAFHRDNIIDPDLAEYLSDDASSGDEQPNLFGVVSDGGLSKGGGDSEKSTFGGLLAAVRKSRSRGGDKSATGHTAREGDDASISSSRAVNLPRSSRRRNLSVASSVHQRLSPRGSKENPPMIHNLHDHPVPPFSLPAVSHPGGFKMTRSSSMRGAGAPPVELNRASMEHVRKLLRQLLKDAAVPNSLSWETALLPILLKATDDVDPDVQHGDDMDVRHYVKLKKILGGRPGDTSYVSGLVFTKNVALKSMPRSISRPNILIITFALEYARQHQHFMSLEPVIRQEREFLENLVNRISTLRPHLLLVQKNVSGLALELLEAANIAVAYNVKPSIIEAVSRCTQTRIVTSMDRLAPTPENPSQCGSFDVKTYVHKGHKKTYMYFSGCPKELGCTIVLRGAEDDALLKVKRITEFMTYVVYNLKLETCLMRDEFAKIPTLPSDATVANENKATKGTHANGGTDNSDSGNGGDSSVRDERDNGNSEEIDDSTTSQETVHSNGQGSDSAADRGTKFPQNLPTPAFYEDIVQKHETKLLSASPFVKFRPPYPLMRARELEQQLGYLKRLRDQNLSQDTGDGDEKAKSQKFFLITPEMIHESPSGAPTKVKEVLHAVHDAEYDRALHNYQTQKRQWEAYISGNSNLFDPYAHQNIVVLYSLVCTTTSIPCSGPEIFALGFYNEHEMDHMSEPDCTLGQYVEDSCHGANSICQVNGCEERMIDHHRQYVHGDAQVSVFVTPYPSKLRGLQDTILMWSCCKICGNETPPMPMSESTWKYSFGKYLELSFCSADLNPRAGVCSHDLHRDHLRFFGYKDMALRIHHDPIILLEVIVPRPRVTWKVDKDLRLRNEIYTKTEKRLNRFMSSVKNRLKNIKIEAVMPELAEACSNEIQALSKRVNDEHAALIKQHQERYINSKYWETIPLNRLIRATQEKVAEWDTIFAEFDRNYFPSEKDIKHMANLQLKKIFDPDASVSSLTPSDETATTTPTEPEEVSSQPTEEPRLRRRMTLSAKEAKNVLTSVVEEHSGKINKEKDEGKSGPPVPSLPNVTERPEIPSADNAAAPQDVKHLDLAITPGLAERLSPPNGGSAQQSESEVSSTLLRQGSPGLQSPSGAPETPPQKTAADHSPQTPEPGSPTPPSATDAQRSGIPRPNGGRFHPGMRVKSPPLLRSQSQPADRLRTLKYNAEEAPHPKPEAAPLTVKTQETPPVPSGTKQKQDKRISERLGLSSLKSNKLTSGHSFIPRSVVSGKKSRVSSLAKHFEHLSREFEKERQREREQRGPLGKQSRAYPMPSSKPIVEVYKTVRDAVEERDAGDEVPISNLPSATTSKESTSLADDMVKSLRGAEQQQKSSPKEQEPQPQGIQQDQPENGAAESRESEETAREPSRDGSEGEEEDVDVQLVESPDELKTSQELLPEDIPLDLKHERGSLVKMLTSFWAERSASGWTALDYPLNDGDHVFADSDIIVREDEPSSLIAFSLDSDDYKLKLASFREPKRDAYETKLSEEHNLDRDQLQVERSLLSHTGTHLKYQFQEGQAKMQCKVFYAEQFDALRRKCGVSERIVDSLSRCLKWDSKGGRTRSLFLKTLDDRFVLKSLSTVETQAFLRFAPAYFQIMSEALFHELPSAIAKMFGFYQVIIKNPVTGVDFNWFLLIMENLFYDRNPTRIFDLKGSMRNRKVQSTGQRNEVLLDENMVEYIYESPLFSREHSKRLLSQSVWNDTLFLARQNVMDYSLMIAIDESRQEIVVGIIDCIRTYTWDKKLESWIKDRGFAGGGKNRPTVTSPKEYKTRFREAMARYVLHAPNPWYQFHSLNLDRQPIRFHDDEKVAIQDENANAS